MGSAVEVDPTSSSIDGHTVSEDIAASALLQMYSDERSVPSGDTSDEEIQQAARNLVATGAVVRSTSTVAAEQEKNVSCCGDDELFDHESQVFYRSTLDWSAAQDRVLSLQKVAPRQLGVSTAEHTKYFKYKSSDSGFREIDSRPTGMLERGGDSTAVLMLMPGTKTAILAQGPEDQGSGDSAASTARVLRAREANLQEADVVEDFPELGAVIDLKAPLEVFPPFYAKDRRIKNWVDVEDKYSLNFMVVAPDNPGYRLWAEPRYRAKTIGDMFDFIEREEPAKIQRPTPGKKGSMPKMIPIAIYKGWQPQDIAKWDSDEVVWAACDDMARMTEGDDQLQAMTQGNWRKAAIKYAQATRTKDSIDEQAAENDDAGHATKAKGAKPKSKDPVKKLIWKGQEQTRRRRRETKEKEIERQSDAARGLQKSQVIVTKEQSRADNDEQERVAPNAKVLIRKRKRVEEVDDDDEPNATRGKRNNNFAGGPVYDSNVQSVSKRSKRTATGELAESGTHRKRIKTGSDSAVTQTAANPTKHAGVSLANSKARSAGIAVEDNGEGSPNALISRSSKRKRTDGEHDDNDDFKLPVTRKQKGIVKAAEEQQARSRARGRTTIAKVAAYAPVHLKRTSGRITGTSKKPSIIKLRLLGKSAIAREPGHAKDNGQNVLASNERESLGEQSSPKRKGTPAAQTIRSQRPVRGTGANSSGTPLALKPQSPSKISKAASSSLGPPRQSSRKMLEAQVKAIQEGICEAREAATEGDSEIDVAALAKVQEALNGAVETMKSLWGRQGMSPAAGSQTLSSGPGERFTWGRVMKDVMPTITLKHGSRLIERHALRKAADEAGALLCSPGGQLGGGSAENPMKLGDRSKFVVGVPQPERLKLHLWDLQRNPHGLHEYSAPIEKPYWEDAAQVKQLNKWMDGVFQACMSGYRP